MELTLIIPGEPTAQGRPRFTTIGGFARTYDPAKSRNYKAFVKLMALDAMKEQGWECTELPVGVEITAYMSIPASKSKKFKQAALCGAERPTKKPDIDNIFKCVTDALSGLTYRDDKQIVSAVLKKKYGEEPKTEITIWVEK